MIGCGWQFLDKWNAMNSDISGFYKLPIKKRVKLLRDFAGLTKSDIKILGHNSALLHETADMMVENVVSTTQLPLGIATHFRINGTDRLVPMAIEESSVVAAASHAAKLARPGGFKTESDEPLMIGQVQLKSVKDMEKAKKTVLSRAAEIRAMANNRDSMLVKMGGGMKDIEVRELNTERGRMLIVHILVDVRDAMGANAVNTYCEELAPYLEELTGGKAVLRIISNLAVRRLVRATAVWKRDIIGGKIIEGILDACAFADADPFRAATHNKGIMNAIDAVLIATCNDWRAAEAGAHAYAGMHGGYKPLTRYWKNRYGDLVGRIELPLAVGLVGGATKIHPVGQVAVKILGVKSARELAEVAAAAGLANNFAAIRAMVKEGIRKGHMKLHATNIAHMAGAREMEVALVAKRLAEEGTITFSRARQLVKQTRYEMRRKKIRKLLKKVHERVHKHQRQR